MNLFLKLLLEVLLILFLVWLFWDYRGNQFREFFIPKLRTRRLYGVSDKTFQRWLERFMPYYAPKWKGRKSISIFEHALIKLVLGDPKEFPTLNKAGIIAKVKEDQELPKAAYRYLRTKLRGTIEKLQLVGISVFPPSTAEGLYQVASGDLDPQ